ncbi:hypothetical protein [Streptomyces anandii]|uniref:hypothetical protein n=1 Tax=Streptomyces anandii TaxID=285454 RepID=UPI003680DF06
MIHTQVEETEAKGHRLLLPAGRCGTYGRQRAGTYDPEPLRAELRAFPRPSPDGEGWEAHITISLRGRSPLRPLAAVVLALTGRWTRRAIVRQWDSSAERWNATVPSLVAMDAEHLRRALSSGPS